MKNKERKIREGLKNSNSNIKSIYIAMLTYYTIFDKLHGTRHVDILHTLYECGQVYTMDGIALRGHISRSTLDRDRKEYLECFTICENLAAAFNEAATTTSLK